MQICAWPYPMSIGTAYLKGVEAGPLTIRLSSRGGRSRAESSSTRASRPRILAM